MNNPSPKEIAKGWVQIGLALGFWLPSMAVGSAFMLGAAFVRAAGALAATSSRAELREESFVTDLQHQPAVSSADPE